VARVQLEAADRAGDVAAARRAEKALEMSRYYDERAASRRS
jgi:hypothetical protein